MYVLVQLLDSPAYTMNGYGFSREWTSRNGWELAKLVLTASMWGFGLDLLDPELQGIGWMICRGSFSVGKQRHRWNDEIGRAHV